MIPRLISWYAKQSHDRAWLVFALNWLWVFAASAIVIMTKQLNFGGDNGSAWLIVSQEMVNRYHAFDEAQSLLPGLAKEDVQMSRTSEDPLATSNFVYTAEGNNMLTPAGLRVVKRVEETYLKHPDFRKFCKLPATANASANGCAPPERSLLAPGVLLSYDWNGASPGYPDLGSLTQDQIDQRLLEISSSEMQRFRLGFFFDANFGKKCEELDPPQEGCSGVWIKSKHVRSQLHPAATPLDDFMDKQNQEEEQEKLIDAHMKSMDEDLFDLLGMKGSIISTPLTSTAKLDGVEVVWMNAYLDQRDFTLTINGDLSWAAASLLAVFAYMAIHTRSLMISVIGMAIVIFSFLLAVFAVKLVFQVKYMDMMLVLIIFVTLGIGADDVFVFMDAFQQSEAVPEACGSLLARIDYTMHRSTKAIFITSLTTLVAFFMTSISDMVNLCAFGLYAGMNIFFLFVLNVLILPSAVVIWSRNFSHLPCCVCHSFCLCCGDLRRKNDEKRQLKEEEMAQRSTRVVSGKMVPSQPVKMAKVDDGCDENFIKAEEGGRALVKQSSSFAAGGEGLGRVEKFFYGPYMRFLERSKYINIALFLALAGLSIYFATLLAPPVDTEAFMPERHMVTKFLNFYSPSAGYWASSTEDMTEDVHLVWGIKGMDTSTRSSVWNTSDRGTLVWDEEFVPFSEAAQKDLLRVCPAIRQMNCRDTTTGCTKSVTDGKRWLVRRSLASPGGEGDCWVEEMENWLLGMNLTMPLPPQEFESKLLEFYETFNGKFREQIGYVEMDGPGNGLALKYLAITFPSTFSAPQAMKVTGPVMDDWEAASREVFNEAEEPRMSNGFMTSGYAFVWYFTQQSLVMNALMGLGLVFAISFVVINIATLNIVMSLITTLVIAGIVVTVLGVGAKGISDWDFGTAESIATVILIGFSMDYCLHLAGAYIESEAYSREDRVRESLTQLGVSVVAGAITTILSGIFLWGTVMIFFQKFAFLITFTVIVSFLWAIVLLPSLLLVIGPQGSFGSWAALFRLCTGKKSNAVTPS